MKIDKYAIELRNVEQTFLDMASPLNPYIQLKIGESLEDARGIASACRSNTDEFHYKNVEHSIE